MLRSTWFKCLTLARLLLTLLVSNGKLEQVFSTLKVLKVDKRSLLGNNTLDDLMVLNTDHIPRSLIQIAVLDCGGLPRKGE